MNHKLMKVGLAFVALGMLVVGTLVALYVAGTFLPREHTASATVQIAAPIDEVWTTTSDFDQMHTWAPEPTVLQRIGNEPPAWRTEDGAITFVFVEQRPPNHLVVDLTAEPDIFGGRWTYTLAERDGGTALTITEDGWVGPPPIRLAMWAGGIYDDTVIAYTAAVKKHHESH